MPLIAIRRHNPQVSSWHILIELCSMYAMGEHDWLWEGSKKHIKEFEEWFPGCPRFDGSTTLGAPHALEWGRVSQGRYARGFGWALEVCAGKRA
jgi:hypothetical protein